MRRPLGNPFQWQVLFLLLLLAPLHLAAPFLHAHVAFDPRAELGTGLHIPGIESMGMEDPGGSAVGARFQPLVEEADLGRRDRILKLVVLSAPGAGVQPPAPGATSFLDERKDPPPRRVS